MGGFDNAKVDAEFLAGTTWRSNFLLNLGHGDPSKLYPRNPRLSLRNRLPHRVARRSFSKPFKREATADTPSR